MIKLSPMVWASSIGPPVPVTQEVQARYFQIVRGENEKYYDWLDFVS